MKPTRTLSMMALAVALASPVRPSAHTDPASTTLEIARPREITIPTGTRLRVRLDTSHASDSSRVEDLVQAHLVEAVVVNGRRVIDADTPITGHVVSARPSGKVKGRGYLAVRFSELRDDDHGRYDIRTRVWAREAPGTKKKDAATIGVPAGVGAVVGGLVGGKKGAAVGAGVGAGAGTGVVLSTSGREVQLPRGATLIVRLSAPLTVRVES